MDLAVIIYQATANFPDSERFGLTNQMRRSAVSVSSNIAEGAGRNGNNEFYNFLGIANGSASELFSQVILARRLEYLSARDEKFITELIKEIQLMLSSLKKSLKK